MSDQIPRWVQAARDEWANRGERRPPFAVEPADGQESVWDYPRPPAVVPDDRTIEVIGANGRIARSSTSVRVLETSLAPSFYLPPDTIEPGALVVVEGSSHCEWKGVAQYLAETDAPSSGPPVPVGWRYPEPYPDFAQCAGWVSFYPDRVRCTVDGEVAHAQAGGFYGGWITDDVVGPFKGEPGTSGW